MFQSTSDSCACASDSAHSRRYDAVCDTDPSTYSMVWMAWGRFYYFFLLLAKMLPCGQRSRLAPAESLSGACGPTLVEGVASRPHLLPLLYHPTPSHCSRFVREERSRTSFTGPPSYVKHQQHEGLAQCRPVIGFMGGSHNILMGPPKRPCQKNKGKLDTPRGLRNILVHHLSCYDQ